MKFSKICITLLFIFNWITAFSQDQALDLVESKRDSTGDYKFSVYTPWLTFSNFGNPETNTHHYEIHFRYRLSPKDRVGIKVATWKLFAPMGIPLWDPSFLDRREFYPGRLRESGLGITYQRRLWKGLFATVEVLPLFTTYLNKERAKLGSGFKLYTSYHLGYHIPLFKSKRFFIEPQIHLNYWPVNTNVPTEFKAKEDGWNNYFFFEPNLYLGIKF